LTTNLGTAGQAAFAPAPQGEEAQWIVGFKDSTSADEVAAIARNVEQNGGRIFQRYYAEPKPVILGFAASFPPHVKEWLESHPAKKYIEANQVATAW